MNEHSLRITEMDRYWAMADEHGWGYEPAHWPAPFGKLYQNLARKYTKPLQPPLAANDDLPW